MKNKFMEGKGIKKILWVIMVALLIIPTVIYAETNIDKIEYMVEEYIDSTLRNDEEDEDKSNEIIKIIMEIEDDVIREKMMVEMDEINTIMKDKLEIENNAKKMLGDYMINSYIEKEENETKKLELMETINKIKNENKRDEMLSSLNEFSLMLVNLYTSENLIINYFNMLKWLIIGIILFPILLFVLMKVKALL